MKHTIYGSNPLTGVEEELLTGDFDSYDDALKQLGRELIRGFKKVGVVPTRPRPDKYKVVNDEMGEEKWFAVVLAVDLNVMGREIPDPATEEILRKERPRGMLAANRGKASMAPPSLADMLNEGKELPESLPDFSEALSDADTDFESEDKPRVQEFFDEGETALQEELEEEENSPVREPGEREEREQEGREEDAELAEIRKEEENR